MELRNLNTFLKVAELKSFSRAADALDYSQSAVTVQIQQLEHELGVQLFDRIGKNVTITQYGLDFISYARDAVSAVARAAAFASKESDLTGVVNVGTIDSLMTASFAAIIPQYRKRFPHVAVRLHSDNITTLRDMLLKNEVDLLYTLDSQLPDPQLIRPFAAEEDVVIVTNAKNPLLGKSGLRLRDLTSCPFILMNRSNAYRDLFDQELARQGLTVQPFLELENDALMLRLLAQNPEYLAVLPRYAVKGNAQFATVPVQDCEMRQWRQVLYHRSKVITPQIQGMLDVLLQAARDAL